MGLGAFILLVLAKVAGILAVVKVAKRKKCIKPMAEKEKNRQAKQAIQAQ